MGKVSSGTGFTACDECAVGKHQPAPGQDDCLDCEPGTYNNKLGASSCTKCAAGKVSSGTGFTACDECAVGKHQPAPGQDVCALCKVGEYSNEHGAVACSTCVVPTTTLASGATNCSACIEGYYWDHRIKLKEDERNRRLVGLGACVSCPQGIDCTNSSYRFLETLFVKKGYFRFSSTAVSVYKCDSIKNNKKQCVGGSATGNDLV